jgi:hypothetical protein
MALSQKLAGYTGIWHNFYDVLDCVLCISEVFGAAL